MITINMKTSELITEIIDKIKNNTKRLITGDILQNILNKILQKSDITFGENRPIIRFEQDEDGYRYLILQELYEDTIGIVTDDIRNGAILYYSTDDNSINTKTIYYGTNIYSGILSDDGEYDGYIYLNTISNNRYDYGKISIYGKDKINNQKSEKIILRGDEDYGVKLNTGILFGNNNYNGKIKYNGDFLIQGTSEEFIIGLGSEFYIKNSEGNFIFNDGNHLTLGNENMEKNLSLYGDNIRINGYTFANLDSSQESNNKLVLNAGSINTSRLKTTYITSDNDVRIIDENDNIYVNFDIDDYEIYIGNGNIDYIDLSSKYNVHVRLNHNNNVGNLELNVVDTTTINIYEDSIDFKIEDGRMSWDSSTCKILNDYITANFPAYIKNDINNKGILLYKYPGFYKPVEMSYIEEPADEYEENGWDVYGSGGANYFDTPGQYNPNKIFKVLNNAGETFNILFGHDIGQNNYIEFVNASGSDTDAYIIFMMDRFSSTNGYTYVIHVLSKYTP